MSNFTLSELEEMDGYGGPRDPIARKLLADLLAEKRHAAIDVAHLERQRSFSIATFGPGRRTEGIIDHISKEFAEILADPDDVKEWIDVVILGLDGAWRTGASPEHIIAGIIAKQTKNEGRVWPDWRTADTTKSIEHDRSYDR